MELDETMNSASASAADPASASASASADRAELRHVLEALLLVVDAPATESQLASAAGAEIADVTAELRAWQAELDDAGSGMDLRASAEGWRLYTRREYADAVERLVLDGARSKLTRAALETLAVIAYRQPVTRSRIAAVRGVNVDGVVRTLCARGLVVEAGNDPETGGLMYRTTELFLERMGISGLGELPDITPLLPDIDIVDELSDDPDEDPRIPLSRRNRGTVEPEDGAQDGAADISDEESGQ